MRSLLLTICLCFLALVAFAQGDRGTITGTVLDPGGAVIASASVEARNVGTGAVFPTATTATGNYTLSQLPTGSYEITVTVPGFKKYVRQNLTVQVAQTIGIDITLEVGTASEAVTVTAEASLLKTETGDMSHNVTSETLNQLPILGVGSSASGSAGIRNPNNVVELIPGTFYQPNSQVKINGAPTNTQAYHVEGMDASNQGFPYAAAQTQPSVDAIQEISVQTSNFAPEFGAAAGGFFNVTMRSGTNMFHGSVYDYFVNEVLNAGTPFTDAAVTDSQRAGQLVRPRARRNDYGWTIGGPVAIPHVYNGHDKTFFFFNFEQFRETQNINNIPITVPTLQYRNGDFSQAITALGNKGLGTDVLGRPLIANTIYNPATARTTAGGQLVEDPFVNNTINTPLDPVALKIQSLIPLPTNSLLKDNYQPNYPSTRHTTIPAVKVDQSIGSRGKLSFYWSSTHTDTQYSPTFGQSEGLPDTITGARGSFIHSHVERLNYDHTLTPTLLLHAGIGYQQNNFFDDAPILSFNAAQTLGLKGATVNRNVPVFTGFCPAAGIGGVACTAAGGMYNMGPSAGQSHAYWQKPAANLSLTWVKENHTYKIGADLYLNGVPTQVYTNTNGAYAFSANETSLPYTVGTTFSGGALGFPYASFLLGGADSYNIAAPASYRNGKEQLAFFIQDSWKVNRKLTVDYGIRYDYGTYYKEQYGRTLDFSPSTPNPSAGGQLGGFLFEGSGTGHCNCDFAKNYPYAIGPRIGLAYQVSPKTVIRAGWGVVYNQTGTTSLGISAAGIAATSTYSTPGQGTPALFLQSGIPAQNTPTWPVISAGAVPASPAGNQTIPNGVGFLDPNAGRPARQNQWSVGIQQEVTRDLVVEAAYVANRGVWWQAPGLVNINALTPQYLLSRGIDINNATDLGLLTKQLSDPTVAARGFKAPYVGFSTANNLAQALRPFPQFGNIAAQQPPLGKTWYDSLQVKATKRLSHGLVFSSAFTFQKSLQQGVDTNVNGVAGAVLNNNILANPANAKSYSSFDQPYEFVLSISYTTPKLQTNKLLSQVLRDWNIGSLLQYASGQPIPTPAATTSLATQLFQSTLANRQAGVPLFTADLNCHCFDPSKTFILNQAAWANPVNGQFGTSSEFYGDFRYQRHPAESLGLGRSFRIKERFALMVRADFSNVFNRTQLNNPSVATFSGARSTTPGGLNSGGFGYINTSITGTQLLQPRQGTIVARITF